MLLVVDKPLIQYAINEAKESGIEEFIFVTRSGKSSLENYIEHAMLGEKFSFVRQYRPNGLGHAILCARHLIDESFAVLLPDDILVDETPCLAQMTRTYRFEHVVAVQSMSKKELTSCGVPQILHHYSGEHFSTKYFVEKPKNPPSNYGVIGRYIFSTNIFDRLERIKPNRNGEIQLTPALGNSVCYMFDGKRFDCGSKIGYMKANAYLGLHHPDLSDDFREYVWDLFREATI